MILIKDGRVIAPKSGMDEPLDIIIRDGIIAGMGKFQKSDDYDTVIDVRNISNTADWYFPRCRAGVDIQTRAAARKLGTDRWFLS